MRHMDKAGKNLKRKWLAAAGLALAVCVTGCGSGSGEGNGNVSEKNEIRSYEVEKYVTLGSYEGMSVEVAGDFEVSEEDVISYINDMLTYYPNYTDTDKQVVEDGDCVDIDYEGKKDGVAFDGGTAEGHVLEIGSDSFIDGFEDGLIGAKVGETRDLNLTFPENYQSAELAGAEVVFTVTVNKIVDKEIVTYDKLTDDFVTSNFDGMESVEALYSETESYMNEDSEENRVVAERAAALDQLMENSKVAVPDGLLEMKVDQYIQQFTNQNCTDGTTLPDVLSSKYNMTEEEFKETITKEMSENLDDELTLEALAKAEGETIDEEGYAKYISEMMTNGNYESEDALYKAYDSNYEDGRTYLENRYLLTNTLTNLVEKCSFSYTGKNADEAE